jgi:hypothetical protein
LVTDRQEDVNSERIIKALESREHVPESLVKYVSLCLQEGTTNRLLEELQRDVTATSDALDRFFGRASQVTGLDPPSVLSTTGFSWR